MREKLIKSPAADRVNVIHFGAQAIRRLLCRVAPPILGMFSPLRPDRMSGPLGFIDA